jgi:hypothetical protein
MLGYPGPPEIGFVLHISPSAAPRRQAKLGSFCTIGPRWGLSPASPPCSPWSGDNWLRFAHLVPRGSPDPAGPRPFPCARRQLASLCTPAPPRDWVRFAQSLLPAPAPPAQIGFVSHVSLSGTRLVRHFGQIGFVCTIAHRLPPFGFVSHESPPPRHRAGARLSPVTHWDFLCDLGVSLVRSSCLAGGQKSALHWLRQTPRVPDPANRHGHRQRWPRSKYRRFSTDVCCTNIKIRAEILNRNRKPLAQRGCHSSLGLVRWK